ncbi:protein RGF1 INDUCIBLE TRANSCRIPTION FACTOR 1-like [Zingiber officinale]|uniref:protein RGF1 INDUCIBLE TRANSCRIPTION FACTOR 1-like n=1 Tax=Zingiber officinale TaxID=94328 RepID=UPI001C4AB1AB|nr:protein RGF1 INDUCIBLE TRANSCRIPTION FACTOR 1-like [Zingiber officinale]
MGRREYDGGGGMPGWLCGLVEESFFVGCPAHESRKKNEKNIFCLGCCTSICPHCAPDHRSHPLLQVRRYVYNDVVRLDDLEKLIDCSYVQPYTINSAKVIFLKPRPQSRPSKGSANICLTCDRILQEPFHFCSLSCKVDHFLIQGEDLSSILVDESEIAFSHFENLRMDSSDPLEDESQMIAGGAIVEEPHNSDGEPSDHHDHGRGSSGTKNNKSDGFFPNLVLSANSNNNNNNNNNNKRRKNKAPQRSHLS